MEDMQKFLKKNIPNQLKVNWRWWSLNLSAVLTVVYTLIQGTTGWSDLGTFDSGLESGKWAIRFLLISLVMTPLNTYFGWNSAVKLRKPAGLWAFGFASLHVLFYLREAKFTWLTFSMPTYLILGLVGMLILSALAVTSNRRSMKQLGKNWKRLHRLVYFAGMAVVSHSLLASLMSKKLIVRDPNAIHELGVYTAILCALLVVRIPLVRKLLQQIPAVLMKRHKVEVQITTIPMVYYQEASSSLKHTLLIPNENPSPPEWTEVGGYLPKTRKFLSIEASDFEDEAEQELESAGKS
jgi:sulfoxide reductase heme-binding subunit YedZ